MVNAIEDIRVDMETVKTRPGTCFNLEAVTTHYVNKGSLAPRELSHALLGKVMAYGFGRVMGQSAILPIEAHCNEMMDDAFGTDFVADVEAIIKHIPKLRSTRDTVAMARKLIDLLILQQTAPPKPVQAASSGQPSSNGAASGNTKQAGQGSKAGNQQQGKQARKTKTGQVPSTPPTDDPHQDSEEHGQSAGAGGSGAGSGGSKRPTAEEIAEMLASKTGYGDLSDLIRAELDSIAKSTPSHQRAGIPLLPEIGGLRPVTGKLNEVEAISASSRMRAKMMGMLQSIKRMPVSYGLSGRKLASGRLARLATGDPRIFRKKVDTVEVNTAVVVLLDLSGSMSSKYLVANAAAFALHNTLFGLSGVAVCSLEFSGKDRASAADINILVNFGRKPASENFNHHPFDGTPTHTAIWAGRVMLLQRPEPRKIMLILTDGCPDKDTETRAATQRVEKEGIEIAAIGIMDGSVRKYWDNHKVIHSIQELPIAMFGVMEGLLTTLRRKK